MVVEVDILFYVRVEPDGSKGCSTRTTECKKFFLVILKYRRCSIVMVMRGRGGEKNIGNDSAGDSATATMNYVIITGSILKERERREYER